MSHLQYALDRDPNVIRRRRVAQAEDYVQTRFFPPLPVAYGALAVEAVDACNAGAPECDIVLPDALNPLPRDAHWDDFDEHHVIAAASLVCALRLEHLIETLLHCEQCGETEDAELIHGLVFCPSCLHDAERSGWPNSRRAIMVTLKSPADVPAAVGAMLGFSPSNSLVVIGLGGSPTARVDADDIVAAIESLLPAVPHWTSGVIVALYSLNCNDVDLVVDALQAVGVTVVLAVRVEGVIVSCNGQTFVATDHGDVAPEALPPVAGGRETLVAAAERVTDGAEALMLAWSSYKVGNGAAAWVYLNRALALGDVDTDSARALRFNLENAVDPR